MSPSIIAEILALNQRLLDAIAAGDWTTYAELCDPSLTCFEPEAAGNLIEGLAFHRFYFELPPAGAESATPQTKSPRTTTMCSPQVRLLGDNAAVVAYVRLVQRLDERGEPAVSRSEETRIWERRVGPGEDGRWRHVHFHRSRP